MRLVRQWPRALSARRLVLLATVASLGAAGAAFGPNGLHQLTHASYSAANAAESMQRPLGFADLVAKVKPAVISVRVKVDAGAEMMGFEGKSPLPPNSQMQRFFRYFGMPDGESMPDGQPRPHSQFVTGQGSGFFISADGYAVTNNHVVDKAKAVEITTDDGKTYDAKVIGTDPRTDLALIKVDGRNDFPYVKFALTAPQRFPGAAPNTLYWRLPPARLGLWITRTLPPRTLWPFCLCPPKSLFLGNRDRSCTKMSSFFVFVSCCF
jgi:serine protease Do